VDLAHILEEVLADHKPAAMAKSIDLVEDLEAAWAEGDAERLRSVVDNLVSNAVKFTPIGGSVKVSVRVEGGGTVIDVCDSGPGIPPEERDRVFDLFYQGSAPSRGSVKGSGLGLSIVAEHVAAHGGRVDIDEGEDRGARLRVWLPAANEPVAS
jgi:two-component system sensor histidine kinase GlrK